MNQKQEKNKIPTLHEIVEIRAKKALMAPISPIFRQGEGIRLKNMLCEHYLDVLLENGSTPDDLEKFDHYLNGIVKWLTVSSSKRRNLLISGPCGVGKTAMMRAMFRTFIPIIPKTEWISAKDVADIYVGKVPGKGWQEINNCECLFIDDLGMEEESVNDYGNRSSPMLRLLHNRFDRNLITIFTTNLNMQQLYNRYDDRLADRLADYYRLIYGADMQSYRGRRTEK